VNGQRRIVERLHATLRESAALVAVDRLVIGLGYTAVVLEDGRAGLAYTWRDSVTGCSHQRGWDGAEGAPAAGLLDLLLSDGGLERSVGMAAANALNHAAALALPEDEGAAGSLVRELGIGRGTHVSMVGFFPPVARVFEGLGVELDVVDDAKGMGDQAAFGERLREWTEVVVMTSTALLGDTADALLRAAGPQARVALLGPTTPLLPGAYSGTRVELLGGTVPRDVPGVLRAVRHGGGARDILPFCRKVYCVRRPGAGGAA
jgi:uncharacterized protein (DUF4213/DUF364 family)